MYLIFQNSRLNYFFFDKYIILTVGKKENKEDKLSSEPENKTKFAKYVTLPLNDLEVNGHVKKPFGFLSTTHHIITWKHCAITVSFVYPYQTPFIIT